MLLKRLIIIIALNIQVYFWTDYSFCENIVTSQMKDDSEGIKYKMYLLIGASTVVLCYFTYYALLEFHKNTYIPYVSRKRLDIWTREYQEFVSREEKIFSEEEALRYKTFVDMEVANKNKSLQAINKFRKDIKNKFMEGDETYDKLLNILNSAIPRYRLAKQDSRSGDFYFVTTLSRSEKKELCYPHNFLSDYYEEIHKSFTSIQTRFENGQINHLSLKDIQMYRNFIHDTACELEKIDRHLGSIKCMTGGLDRKDFMEAHVKLDGLLSLFEGINKSDPLLSLTGIANAGLSIGEIKSTFEYLQAHQSAKTIDNLLKNSITDVYIPGKFSIPERIDRAIDLNEIFLPTTYDVVILFSYGFLGGCHMFFGTPNPISYDIMKNSLENLINRFLKKK